MEQGEKLENSKFKFNIGVIFNRETIISKKLNLLPNQTVASELNKKKSIKN